MKLLLLLLILIYSVIVRRSETQSVGKCTSDDDCAPNRRCWNGGCALACQDIDCFEKNSHCIVKDHRPTCGCKAPYEARCEPLPADPAPRRRFVFLGELLTWYAGEQRCSEFGRHLAVLKTKEDNEEAKEDLLGYDLGPGVWIGCQWFHGTTNNPGKLWIDTNDTESYTDWHPEIKDHNTKGGCVYYEPDTLHWKIEYNCKSKKYIICQNRHYNKTLYL